MLQMGRIQALVALVGWSWSTSSVCDAFSQRSPHPLPFKEVSSSPWADRSLSDYDENLDDKWTTRRQWIMAGPLAFGLVLGSPQSSSAKVNWHYDGSIVFYGTKTFPTIFFLKLIICLNNVALSFPLDGVAKMKRIYQPNICKVRPR